MSEIPKAPVIRIIKNEGAERISKDAEEIITTATEDYVKKLGNAIIDVANNANRKTIQKEDVELVLKHFN